MKSENKTELELKDFTTIMPTKSVEKGCNDIKKCSKCLKSLNFQHFSKHPRGKFGLHSVCRLCRKQYESERKEQRRKYIQSHYLLNKKYYQQRDKQRLPLLRKKRKTNTNFRISCNLRSRISQAIKTGSAVRDLGCSIEQFKKHLESKFTKGMNWENYGFRGWHIDHIRPLSKFDLTNREDFLLACHYTNLQPLWWFDNLSKGSG